MDTVAILIDGGFYIRKAKALWGDRAPQESADILHRYACAHLFHAENGVTVRDKLYRIFYYDCPPMDRNVYHPLLQKDKSLKMEPIYSWMTDFQEALRSKRKVALRLGRLSDYGIGYTLSMDIIKKLCSGKNDYCGASGTGLYSQYPAERRRYADRPRYCINGI